MTTKPDCFVIMPIDNPEVEFLWEKAFIPTCDKIGFAPIRLDKKEDGTPLYQQIVNYVSNSSLIIADLTLARPNCYFEIGYAYGLEKYNNLILTCRWDHCPDSKDYKPGGHKVHFDVQTFGIIWWEDNQIDDFIGRLSEKIRTRKEIITKPIPVPQDKIPRTDFGKNRTSVNDLIKRAERELREWKK